MSLQKEKYDRRSNLFTLPRALFSNPRLKNKRIASLLV